MRAKRLEALESLEDLGAGFVLATHDLEIRGAGELLGEGQSGEMTEVGLTMYLDMLDRAVKAMKAGRKGIHRCAAAAQSEVEMRVPALLPDDYVGDVHVRLALYKRMTPSYHLSVTKKTGTPHASYARQCFFQLREWPGGTRR
jgi:transcription-repair coupling factor (superfamily II helicase)